MRKTNVNRRRFLAATAAGLALPASPVSWVAAAERSKQLQPIGDPQGIYPGRVVWVHDPEVINWSGPGNGHWWEGDRVQQERVDAMMARAVCELTGEGAVARAWARLFRHLNQARGKGDVSYHAGEKIVIKPNWVGMIYREGHVDSQTYTFHRAAGLHEHRAADDPGLAGTTDRASAWPQSDITVCDTLACLVHEYYDLLHRDFPSVRYEDYAGKFGRIKVSSSTAPLYWSCRPQGEAAGLPTHLLCRGRLPRQLRQLQGPHRARA